MHVLFALATALLRMTAGSDVVLATFDGSSATSKAWTELNDPVMGGQSTGSAHVDSDAQALIFQGEVVNVPKLKAPGFIATQSEVGKFPDASSAYGGELILSVRSSTPEYTGFKVTFNSGSPSAKYSCAGGGQLPLSRGCFKASFSVPAGDAFSEVRVPFTSFSDLWDPATGEQKKTCAEDSSVCPTAERLAAIQMLEFMAEGKAGKIDLEVKSISAGKSGNNTSVLLV
eukprot:TRINITY_DN107536_c0_g1_i1.p1 TRINITY_DN107536_c0_g1~~TRINITY_DN107536_c0_g1_i1.p1  ORF type:complete len:256 (+),score=68.75 TRINITY_DN107536_c0_g1_i1:82-768(+)